MASHGFLLALSLLVMTTLAAKPRSVLLKKCCAADEKLSFTLRAGLICERVAAGPPYWWLPSAALRPGVQQLLEAAQGVEYAAQPDCALNAMDSLRHSPEGEMDDFRLHVRDGEVRLEATKEGSLHDPDVAREDSFPPSSYCVDAGPGKNQHLALFCPCEHIDCVRKCCSDGFVFNHTSMRCVADDEIIDWVPRLSSKFQYYRLLAKLPVCDELKSEKVSSHIIPTRSNRSQVLLFPNASIQVPGRDHLLRPDSYCGTYSSLNEEMLLFCFRDKETDWIFILYGVLFLVGAAALLATVFITGVLPEMRRNIHGRMSLAHNVMLLVGYTAMGISQLQGKYIRLKTCAVISFVIQFSILSAFFWLNVMCVDISWTFSGLRPIQGSAMQRDRKKFIYYSLYVWGSTTLITIATATVEYSSIATGIKPNFGDELCYFNNHWAMFIFFYGPMALLLLANLCLFIYTAMKIIVVRRDTAILSAKDSSINAKNKQKLILYVKLFGLMGITYVTEVISWAVGGTSYWWYVTDTINILRAVFIFVIFCCKRTVYSTIKNKVLSLLGREVSSTGLTRSYQSHTSCTTASVITTATPKSHKMTPSARGVSNSSLMSNLETQVPNPRA